MLVHYQLATLKKAKTLVAYYYHKQFQQLTNTLAARDQHLNEFLPLSRISTHLSPL